jgi:lipopolysaccharide biosynthesis regulator YciM
LTRQPSDLNARLSRAIAFLAADQLDRARADYLEVLKTSTNMPDALFGLGTIAWREQDTNRAVTFYRQYVSSKPLASPQYKIASERLQQLEAH